MRKHQNHQNQNQNQTNESNKLGLAKDDLIVIIGGGIAGFALQNELLNERSFKRVIVLERDSCADQRRQGYGLTVSETNTKVLRIIFYIARVDFDFGIYVARVYLIKMRVRLNVLCVCVYRFSRVITLCD